MNLKYIEKLDTLTGPDALVTHRQLINEYWHWVYIEKSMSVTEAYYKVYGLLLGLKLAGLVTEQEYYSLRKYYDIWFSL